MGPIKKSHIRLNHNSIVKFSDLMLQGPINKAKLMSFLQLSEKFPNADLTGIQDKLDKVYNNYLIPNDHL